MAAIATLPSLLGTLAKFIGVVLKDGLSEDFFQKIIDDPAYRARFVAAEQHGFYLTQSAPKWRKVDEFTIEVNYDALPKLPLQGAVVEWTKPGLTSWHMVQLRGDDLFIDDRKITLYLTEEQKVGSVVGHELRKQLEGQTVLHPNVLDSLMDNTHLIPSHWKKNDNGDTLYIFFYAVRFRRSGGSQRVRCLYWSDGRWRWYYRWPDSGWGVQNPAAVLAS